MVNQSRLLQLRNEPSDGSSVIYVMSRDQRVRDNHALLAAQAAALEHNVPLYVLFILRAIAGRSREHYEFMLDGLEQVSSELSKQNIPFIMRRGDAKDEIMKFCDEVNAGAVFFDFSPLTHARSISRAVADAFTGSVSVVDTHNIIPVWIASDKQEFAAHTLRRKIHKQLETYLEEPEKLRKHAPTAKNVASLSSADARKFVSILPQSGISLDMKSGEAAARARLKEFIDSELQNYAHGRNDCSTDMQSGLSPYLHYGQISSLRVALDVTAAVDTPPLLLRQAKMQKASDSPSHADGMNALLEEMIVRKELSDNFCFYNQNYKSLNGAPDWARKTLENHAADQREFIYNLDEWESATTHDDAWNASQMQLSRTGKLHGYLRMYWAKKLLEWSKTPDEALRTAIYLNDKYSIDGGDPNGYVGILWSIAGLHDRAWSERPVYGKIRYMNVAGLKRKYDIDAYITTWLDDKKQL